MGLTSIALQLLNTQLAIASVLTPPVLPLIVRTPYLSTWLPKAREPPWNHWPIFYTGEELGLLIMAFVPNTSTIYPLIGRVSPDSPLNLSFPTYLGSQFDASSTNLSFAVTGAASDRTIIDVSFLSPLTPTSTLRQSIPAAYVTIAARGDLDVHIYMDVNGQWTSGDRGANITWSLQALNITDGSQVRSWQVERAMQQPLAEYNDRAEWGTLYFTAPYDTDYQCGVSGGIRSQFARTGSLSNAVDTDYRSIMDEEPVFAFSKHLKPGQDTSSNSSSKSITFTIAHVQDPVVQFASARGLTYMRPLWKAYFAGAEELVTFHYHDFHTAASLSGEYSEQLATDAYKTGGSDYQDIVSLSARQVMGATSFSGTPENPLLFLKEISSNGNSQTVDVIFPSFPFFLYTNPRWLAYLLEPLLEHMLSGQYPNNYTMHDLGAHFPNLTGHADGNDEYMPVEECGDMLIMGLALINSMHGDEHVSGSLIDESAEQTIFAMPSVVNEVDQIPGLDIILSAAADAKAAHKWLRRSYSLWQQWTGYLVRYSLEPENQLCTDDFAGWLPLQTNLALKGIIGIRAMSRIAAYMGRKDEAAYYQNTSDAYIKKWEAYAMSPDGRRAKLAYFWQSSWTTLYSLYANSILCFNKDQRTTDSGIAQHVLDTKQTFIPPHIYETQSKWYSNAMQKYGLPLDSRHLYAKSDWQMQAAAVASGDVRRHIVSRMAKWLNETSTDRPFSDLYNTEGDGGFPGPNFFARPVVGSHFALLAVEKTCPGGGF